MDKTIKLSSSDLNRIIDLIYNRYGYDFRNYATGSLSRRIEAFMHNWQLFSVIELENAITDSAVLEKLVESISVTVTKMFRDPEIFKQVRTCVIPELKKLPSVKIWHAGCATGEEAYSLAIILEEEGLSNAEITATDMNRRSIEIAKSGVYPSRDIKLSTHNYLKTGGTGDLSDYYTSRYSCSIFSKSLRKRINFKHHNLSSDLKLDDFDLIICRNVFIYFTKKLQRSVFKLFNRSLKGSGYLWLGSKENLLFIDNDKYFTELEKKSKIFKKVK